MTNEEAARHEALLNDFAIRSFRDVADGDYIAARMACRAALVVQYLWASEQAIEKYLKCILLLNRIPAARVRHDLGKALEHIASSGKVTLELCAPTRDFISYIDDYGAYRYFESSHWAEGSSILTLDRAIYELRQHCTTDRAPRHVVVEHEMPPKIQVRGGMLEKLIDNGKKSEKVARDSLLWQNAFFGNRTRRHVRIGGWVKSSNSPLSMRPEIIEKVTRYVYLPKDLIAWCRDEVARQAAEKRKTKKG